MAPIGKAASQVSHDIGFLRREDSSLHTEIQIDQYILGRIDLQSKPTYTYKTTPNNSLEQESHPCLTGANYYRLSDKW